MRLAYSLSVATCLTLIAAIPSPQHNPDNPNDDVLPDVSMWGEETEADIRKPCTDSLVVSRDRDPREVWDGLGCHYLVKAMESKWLDGDSNLKFIDAMSDSVHGPGNMNCEDINSAGCNAPIIQCDETFFSCGHLILNSYANIHAMHKAIFDQITVTHDSVQDKILPSTFSETFAPQLKDDLWKDMLVGMVGMAAVGSGAMVDGTLKKLMQGKGMFSTIRDGALIGTTLITPFTMNHIPDPNEEAKTINQRLALVLSAVYDGLRTMQSDLVKGLFSGSTEGRLALHWLTSEGAFISDAGTDWQDVETAIKKAFFGTLIPEAWRLAPKKKDQLPDGKWSDPFFINSNKPCGEKPDDWDERTGGKDFKEICYEDEAWFLMAGHRFKKGTVHVMPHQGWELSLEGPPGSHLLFQEGGYEGLTAEDMLISAVGGWKEGDHQQYWKMPTDKPLITGDYLGAETNFELNYGQGVREPGYVQMLVCSNWVDAMDTFVKGHTNGNHGSPYWPCG